MEFSKNLKFKNKSEISKADQNLLQDLKKRLKKKIYEYDKDHEGYNTNQQNGLYHGQIGRRLPRANVISNQIGIDDQPDSDDEENVNKLYFKQQTSLCCYNPISSDLEQIKKNCEVLIVSGDKFIAMYNRKNENKRLFERQFLKGLYIFDVLTQNGEDDRIFIQNSLSPYNSMIFSIKYQTFQHFTHNLFLNQNSLIRDVSAINYPVGQSDFYQTTTKYLFFSVTKPDMGQNRQNFEYFVNMKTAKIVKKVNLLNTANILSLVLNTKNAPKRNDFKTVKKNIIAEKRKRTPLIIFDQNNNISIMNGYTFRIDKKIQGHSKRIKTLNIMKYKQEPQFLLSCGLDNIIKIFDIQKNFSCIKNLNLNKIDKSGIVTVRGSNVFFKKEYEDEEDDGKLQISIAVLFRNRIKQFYTL